MKRLFVLFGLLGFLLMSLPADSRAGSGFGYHSSSITTTGDLYAPKLFDDNVRVSTFNPNFVSSTVFNTAGPWYTTTQTVPTACITGSTLTFTALANETFWVGFSGVEKHTGTGSEVYMSFRLNGQFPAPLSSTLHVSSMEGNVGDEHSWSWMYPITPGAGTHTVCFVVWVVSGTLNIAADDMHTFYVQRIK